ncbi:hypothetical protein DNTS_009259 [Danionella cerebrum]|uniref:Peptide deformylase n=1 Tax=Danionella cerebrum TaxID=2873325 RepID=A0A553Q5L3_9TELE|nr:hypothetical protein DNTS_009259 [Danionella translucida]
MISNCRTFSHLFFKTQTHNLLPKPLGILSPFTSTLSAHSHSTKIKERSYWGYLKRKIKGASVPPYSHVCQVGDPILRGRAEYVNPGEIQGAEVQTVIKTLVKVMRNLECVGLSAPQIGVSLRILVLEYPRKMLEDWPPEFIEARGVVEFPLKIFVNPQLRVLDGQKVLFPEGCESISGYAAFVPRYLSVEVSGLNEKAESVTWQASGWPARILQHEMDHLDGTLYIDHMDSKTFVNVNWEEFNE